MPQVSVIVPVYKVEFYLCRCVDSILNQTFRDFELILVDDGSPDDCGAICDAYALKDERVHVIHQRNGGLSAARNAGIDWVFANSDSKWIHFVDSDDWIHPQMLEQLLNAAMKYNSYITAAGHYDTHGETPEVETADFHFQEYSPEEYYTTRNMNAVMAVAKLYSRDCFSDIRYPNGKIHEDMATSYKVLFAQKKIAVTDMPLYFYFQNPEGTTKSAWTAKRLDAIPAMEGQILFFNKNKYRKAYEYATIGYVSEIILSRERAAGSDLPPEEKKRIIRQLNRMLYKAIIRYGGIYLTRDVGIYVDAFPGLAACYRQLKRFIRRA